MSAFAIPQTAKHTVLRWHGGKPAGPIQLRPLGSKADSRPADFGVTGANSYHFLVETSSTTIDGNTLWSRIQRVNRAAKSSSVRLYEFTR